MENGLLQLVVRWSAALLARRGAHVSRCVRGANGREDVRGRSGGGGMQQDTSQRVVLEVALHKLDRAPPPHALGAKTLPNGARRPKGAPQRAEKLVIGAGT